jgi:integrase
MTLTVLQVQKAKPKEKPYKLTDGKGLYLLVSPNGSKCWRYKYYWLGRERVLALGVFPEVSLVEARDRHHEARRLKAQFIDPSEHKREQKMIAYAKYDNTFEKIAREWHGHKMHGWSAYYAKQVMQRLESDIFPRIGNRLTNTLTASDLLKVARSIEARDAIEMAHRSVAMCGQIFQYAIITDRATQNPAVALRGALRTIERKHRPYIKQQELPEFLRRLNGYERSIQTKLAIQLLMLTFVRPSELCKAKWSEIDFERREWRIPAERMKMRTPHIVPLSNQAFEILSTLHKLNGRWEYVLPSTKSPRKCVTTNSLLFVVWELGYKGKATAHGFRGTASTILNESGQFNRDVIERQLSHLERNRIRAAYDHAEHLPARQHMMQWWADYLDSAASESNATTSNFVNKKSA